MRDDRITSLKSLVLSFKFDTYLEPWNIGTLELKKAETMKKALIIFIVLLLVAAAGFIIYKYVYNKPEPEVVLKETEVKVNAKRLWVDYSMNKDIAAPRYDGKLIEVTGSIMRVETVEEQVIVVFAFKKGESGDEGIRVTMLPAYYQAAKGINPFKNVTIKGLCKEYNGQNIIMEHGSIIGNQ
jgi:hypothetical protein